MRSNPARGEVTITINGTKHTLRLTLGALAGLEQRLETGSLMGLAEHFESGRVGSAELMALISAGLQGAGHDMTEADLAKAEISGGPIGAMHAGMELLSRTFQPYHEGA